ncbi:MAG: hypothetical protein ABUK08_00335 [Candidatus Humimicrobiaceae bacterium]
MIVAEGALVNINGLNYKFNKGVPYEAPIEKETPPCYGNFVEDGDLCITCLCKHMCIETINRAKDKTEQMKKEYYKSYFISEIKKEDLPKCFGTYDRTKKGECQSCMYGLQCVEMVDMLDKGVESCLGGYSSYMGSPCNNCRQSVRCIREKNKKKEVKPHPYPLPNCFTKYDYRNDGAPCGLPCFYKRACEKATCNIGKCLEALKPVIITPSTPGCFGTKLESGCRECSHKGPCKRYYDKIGSVTIKEVVKPLPPCVGSTSDTICSCSPSCKFGDICTQIRKKLQEVREAKEAAKIAPVPSCFGISYSEKSCNHDCNYKYSCKKVFDKIETSKVIKSIPTCFSYRNPQGIGGCAPCGYNRHCKVAYDKIEGAKKDSIDKIIKSVADTVSKNMKDTLVKQPAKMPWEG